MSDFAVPGAVLRLTFYGGLLLGVGAVVIRSLARSTGRAGPELLRAIERRSGHLGSVAMLAALAATLLRLPVQLAELRMPGEPIDLAMTPMLLGTTWGDAWMLQVASTLVAAIVLWLAAGRRGSGRVWAVAAVATAIVVLSVGVSGHAAEGEGVARLTLFVVHVAHVGGVALWIGTLAMIVGAVVPASRLLPTTERGTFMVAILRRFSPLALGAAAALAASGTVAGIMHVGSFPALSGSGYGRLLLGKLAIVLAVAALGAYHWRRAPGLVEHDERSFLRTATAEVGLAALVLAVTAFLVATPLPIPS